MIKQSHHIINPNDSRYTFCSGVPVLPGDLIAFKNGPFWRDQEDGSIVRSNAVCQECLQSYYRMRATEEDHNRNA